MAFSEEVLNSIKERLNFPEIVGEYVQLKRSGRNFVGLCPFHAEKTPSFFVRGEEASFHCFGCGKKGSVFQFIMEMRGFRFPESVRYLAKLAGVVLPEDDGAPSVSSDLTKNLQEVVLCACEVFEENLQHSPEAKEYLRQRGISEAVSARYHLGYAPKAWDYLFPRVAERVKRRNSIKELQEEDLREYLLQVGLLKCKTEEGEQAAKRYYDAFRERIIFPITRSDGRPIAFGGRTLSADPQAPKYINSTESALYLKRKSLFGIFQALPEARRERHIFLVEGYMDVISMNQLGITDVVASCGTAATAQHAEVLKRFVDSVTLLFDGDAAGRKAAASCFSTFLNSGLDVEVVFLPSGEDPDSLARTHSQNEFRKLLEVRMPNGEAFLKYLVGEESGEEGLSAAASGRIAAKYATVVSQVKNAVEREFLIRKGAQVLGVSVDAIDVLVGQETRRHRPGGVIERQAPSNKEGEPEEVQLRSKFPRPSSKLHKDPKAKQQLDLLYRQLLVAALCEPQISSAAMQIATQEAAGNAIRSELSFKSLAFIEEFVRSGLPGIHEFVAEKRAAGRKGYIQATEYGSAQALLAAHGLEEDGVLEEAFRQVQIGGSNPNALLEESSSAFARLSHEFEVQLLRTKEAHSLGEGDLLQIAQEKLEKRRTLEKFRAPLSPNEEK